LACGSSGRCFVDPATGPAKGAPLARSGVVWFAAIAMAELVATAFDSFA